MNRDNTAGKAHVTERQKAWARLALLTVIGLVCPPLAAARSGLVWGLYLLLVVLYSLWALRMAYKDSSDRLHGYLLTFSDAVVLIPLMVWSPGFAMRFVLALVWFTGASATLQAARARSGGLVRVGKGRTAAVEGRQTRETPIAEPLRRALGARLRVLFEEGTRFGLVLLRITEHKDMVEEYGKEGAQRLLRAVGLKGLRYLGADAQLFLLAGGRVAFVFATDASEYADPSASEDTLEHMEARDVETRAMSVARKSCEDIIDGYRMECVVGWAAAPADGTCAEDLMDAAESGVLSKAAFRRVGGTLVPVPQPEKKRAVAG